VTQATKKIARHIAFGSNELITSNAARTNFVDFYRQRKKESYGKLKKGMYSLAVCSDKDMNK